MCRVLDVPFVNSILSPDRNRIGRVPGEFAVHPSGPGRSLVPPVLSTEEGRSGWEWHCLGSDTSSDLDTESQPLQGGSWESFTGVYVAS